MKRLIARPILFGRYLLPRLVMDLSNTRQVRWIFGVLATLAAALLRGKGERARELLLGAHRTLLWSQFSDRPVVPQRIIEAHMLRHETRFSTPMVMSGDGNAPADLGLLAKRMIVLSAPAEDRSRKGVLLVMFTAQFVELTAALDLALLCRDYHLVLEPSYSGYADTAILQFKQVAPAPVFVMATEQRDFAFLERVGGNLIPVRLGSSDWVDPQTFTPLVDTEKRYDAIMVAGWERLKRHHALFSAIADLNDPSYRLCLIGSSWRGSRQEIEGLLTYYGLSKQAELFEKLTPVEVNRRLNESRVNVLMTRREGSNRSLFEGMFADVPALALSSVIGPNLAWLNSEGGRLVEEGRLSEALVTFRGSPAAYRPRAWALENISPVVSTRTLERAISRAVGSTAVMPLAVKVNAPELRYLDENRSDALPTADELIQRYAVSR